jgi:hypothetical protein
LKNSNLLKNSCKICNDVKSSWKPLHFSTFIIHKYKWPETLFQNSKMYQTWPDFQLPSRLKTCSLIYSLLTWFHSICNDPDRGKHTPPPFFCFVYCNTNRSSHGYTLSHTQASTCKFKINVLCKSGKLGD